MVKFGSFSVILPFFGTNGRHCSQCKAFWCKSNKIKTKHRNAHSTKLHTNVQLCEVKCHLKLHIDITLLSKTKQVYWYGKRGRTAMRLTFLKWRNRLEKVRWISAEFTKMAHRIFIFLAQNSDNPVAYGVNTCVGYAKPLSVCPCKNWKTHWLTPSPPQPSPLPWPTFWIRPGAIRAWELTDASARVCAPDSIF